MKSFWAKITAFFMTIVAFFTGLFTGGSKPPVQPPPEPTSAIVQPTEPASDPVTDPTIVTQPATDPASGSELVLPRIVTTTAVFGTDYPAEQTVERLARLGYEAIDMSFSYCSMNPESPFLGDDYLAWAESLKQRADRAGILYTHAHAPNDIASGDLIARSIRAASVMGITYCNIHPIVRNASGAVITNKDEFISVNANAFRQWLPTAEENNVILLVENITTGASGDPRIIADLVKEVDSPWFGWCFDTGHAHCKGYRPDILTACSVAPLSLHIQDSNGGDDHLIPGDGRIDWNAFVSTLKTIGYTGDCVLEAHHQSLYAPDEERDAILSRLLEKGKELQTAMAYPA